MKSQTQEQDRTQEREQTQTGIRQATSTATEEAERVEPIAIYQNNIFALVDDLKQDEQFQGLSNEELKNNKAFFPSLVQYIYNNYIGDLLGNNLSKHYKVTYPDISILNNLFNIYISLVNKYKWNNRPSILEFSIFTGISRDTFYQWLKGEYINIYDNNNNNNGYGVVDNNNIIDIDNDKQDKRKHITSLYTDSVKKWSDICEQSLVDGNGEMIKEIFLLKARHNYKDSNNTIEVNINHKEVIPADALPALLDLKNTEKP